MLNGPADICLISEGGWPHVPGSAANGVARILAAMPELRFAVLHLGSDPDAPRQRVYDIPTNVVAVSEVFVQDLGTEALDAGRHDPLSDEDWAAIDACQRCLADGEAPDLAAVCAVLERFRNRDELLAQVVASPRAWNLAVQHYLDTAPRAPFLQHWWTGRLINATTLHLLRTVLPEARLYHALGTGFAGLLGAKARQVLGRPFLLSESTIYQRERRRELFDAAWIRGGQRREHLDLREHLGASQERWECYFRALARSAYESASAITARSDADRACQIADGADPDRTIVMPPGLDLSSFAAMARASSATGPLRLGLIGPLTPDRDWASVLQALDLLRRRGVAFTATIIAPPGEDPAHRAACAELIAGLGLTDQVTCADAGPVLEPYAHLDAVVVMSLVEDSAPTLLEACAAGLPVVASDVGASREVLLGRSAEDRHLGPAGLLVPPATPLAIADALTQLAQDAALRRSLGTAGKERTRRYYDQRDALDRMREWYAQWLATPISKR